jgi:hypothetical protein
MQCMSRAIVGVEFDTVRAEDIAPLNNQRSVTLRVWSSPANINFDYVELHRLRLGEALRGHSLDARHTVNIP